MGSNECICPSRETVLGCIISGNIKSDIECQVAHRLRDREKKYTGMQDTFLGNLQLEPLSFSYLETPPSLFLQTPYITVFRVCSSGHVSIELGTAQSKRHVGKGCCPSPQSFFSCGTKDALARPYLLSHVQKAVYWKHCLLQLLLETTAHGLWTIGG